MIEACLKSKIITKFLKNYKEKKWIKIIPSLLEIAILNLYHTFKKIYFSENDLLLIIQKLSNQKKLNKIRNDYHLDIYDSLNKRRYSYKSLEKKEKNINELNIYSSGVVNNKFLHNYYKSCQTTPIRRLNNCSETEGNLQSNKFKSFWKFDKILNSNNKNNNKNNNAINYNTVNINNTYRNEKKYLSMHNSILLDNNYSNIIEKEYIKVNKVHKAKKKKNIKINEDLKINNTFTENIKDIANKNEKINKNSRIQLINNFKQEDIFLNNKFKDNENLKKYKNGSYNLFQKQNISSDKISKYNNIKYHSISKDFSINEPKKIKIKHICNKINMKKITMKEIRNKQLSNLNRNKINNNNTFQNINPTLIIKNENFNNVDDINFNSNIKTEYNNLKKERKIKLIKGNQKNKIINYNSFNKDILSKNRTFINDPYFLIKPINKKESIIKK